MESMKFINAPLLAIAVVFGMMAASPPPTFAAALVSGSAITVVTVEDATLAARIEKGIKKDSALDHQNIDVAVYRGVATLTGSVRTESGKSRAGRHAAIPGVSRVDNRLKIDVHAGQDATASAAQATADASAKVTAAKTADVAATAGAVDSTWITATISAKFVDEPLLKGSNINVDVVDHSVNLKGTVTSEAGSAKAEAIASVTDGVHGVINALTVVAAE
jgi:osmotically-inducible protein OsmY